jgi:hypothetical protein
MLAAFQDNWATCNRELLARVTHTASYGGGWCNNANPMILNGGLCQFAGVPVTLRR